MSDSVFAWFILGNVLFLFVKAALFKYLNDLIVLDLMFCW